LEFGCSAGMLGKAYKEKNPDTLWHGVEINKEAVKLAKDNIDGAWIANANDFKPNKTILKAAPYDAILELLRPGGELIACIPNVQHWTLMKQVLKGNWNYQRSGLLDNTHLRFFTRKSIRHLLTSLDLEFVEQQRFSHENITFAKREKEKRHFLQTIKAANQALGIEFNEYDFRTFQYFIRAKKK